MTFGDFKRQFKAEKLMRSKTIGGETYCEVLGFKDSKQDSEITDIAKFKTALNGNQLVSARVRKQVTGGSFSLDTKAILTPSIPFKMTFNGKDITIKTMTLFHPSPVRVDASQADAVLCLNDPSDTTNTHILLVPLVSSNFEEPSVTFLRKVVPSTTVFANLNPITGTYTEEDVATGNDWSLTKLFSVDESANGNSAVTNGYFVWEGIPSLERYFKRNDSQIVHTGWRRSGSPGPTYILLEKPLQIGATDLATLFRVLPVTNPLEAIHPIPQKGVTYKQGPPPENCDTTQGFFGGSIERYTQLNPSQTCDPFLNNAINPSVGKKQYTPQMFWSAFFYFLTFVAMFVGAYIAMIIILGEGDQTVRFRSEDIGKLMALWVKSVIASFSTAPATTKV